MVRQHVIPGGRIVEQQQRPEVGFRNAVDERPAARPALPSMVKLTAPSTSGMRVVRYWPFCDIVKRLGRSDRLPVRPLAGDRGIAFGARRRR